MYIASLHRHQPVPPVLKESVEVPQTIATRLLLFCSITTSLGCDSTSPDTTPLISKTPTRQASFTRKIDWIGTGIWLKADTHVHTRFSDGRHTVEEVVSQAEHFQCDVVAITDHTDGKDVGSPAYIAAIQQARIDHPELIIIAGLEWNVPPWGGDDHATVLCPPGNDHADWMTLFAARFDDYGREVHDPALADEALRWLATQVTPNGVKPVVFFNHPSRKWATSEELLQPLKHLGSLNNIMVGFSGAPGHQAGINLSAYSYKITPLDRWDPVAAEVGGVWDTLLGQGVDLWAARAPSDFHRTTSREKSWSDYWPGEFSETWVYAPERSANGVLRALRAGSFFAGHGHIAREVILQVNAPGLERPATPGESVEASAGTPLCISLYGHVPASDWSGTENRLDRVEIIAITPEGSEITATEVPTDAMTLVTHSMQVPTNGVILRARGRRVIDDGPDLLFYTNPVRVTAVD